MRRQSCVCSIAIAFLLLCVSHGQTRYRKQQGNLSPDDSPTSFYIAVQAVSDASPFWFDYVIDVTEEQEQAHLRLIRVAPLDDICPENVTVKTKEATVPAVSVRELTAGMCRITGKQVDRAVSGARPKRRGAVFESASDGIVTRCGDAQELLKLPMPEEIDGGKLNALHPQIGRLWNLPWKLFELGFHGNPLASSHGEFDAESQQAAEPLIPKLRTGIYDSAFWNRGNERLSSTLRHYHGVAITQPLTGEVVDKSSFRLAHYVAARYPEIAKAARVSGDVNVTFEVDPSSGATRNAKALDGHPMLRQAAVDAVLLWRFERPSTSQDPTAATFRFELAGRCRD